MISTPEYQGDLEWLDSLAYPWDELTGKTVLVTGATGMIGSLLTDVLIDKSEPYGFSVIAMARDRNRLEKLFGERSREKSIKLISHDVTVHFEMNYDYAFHCASNTHPMQYSADPVGTITTNVIGLQNVLKNIKKSGRLVCISSVEIYGANRGDNDVFNEQYCGYIDPNTVRSGYNESKRLCESLCQAYKAQFGLDFVTARLSRTYGPSLRIDDTKAMSQMIMNACKGEDIVLKSKGNQRFSYCYSADAVNALLFLLFNGKSGEAYNVSSNESDISLKELAEYICSISGTGIKYEIPSSSEKYGYSTAVRALLDTTRIKQIGWESHYTLRDGIKRTISSIKADLF